MSNVINFRKARYDKMEPVDLFMELACKEEMDALDEAYFQASIVACGFTAKDLEEFAKLAMQRALQLMQ